MGPLGCSIRQVSGLLKDGFIIPTELCEAAIQRAEKTRPLNAFITLAKDAARNTAQQSDKRYRNGEARGPLDGIPVAVKDNFCTHNLVTTCGSQMLKAFVPKYNATVVQKLFDSGAVLLGKCNMDEFAMGSGTVDSVFGPTKNIWQSEFDPALSTCRDGSNSEPVACRDWYIAGGSSGGSAVAVASGAAFAALGSDTGGSTRNPASYCGVVGFKPTFGLLSRHGLIPLVNSMDVPGILARTVDDVTTVLNAVAGWDPMDSTTIDTIERPAVYDAKEDLHDICVGIPLEYHSPGLSEEILNAWNDVADTFEKAGARVVQVSMPHTEASIACYAVLNQCEVASNMARYDGIEFGLRSLESKSTEELIAKTRKEGFGEVVRSRILAGNYFLLQRNYVQYFLQALKIRRLIVNDFEKVWSSGVDVLLTPTTLTDAPKYKDFISLENQQQCVTQDYCTQPVNLAGYPAISVPITLSKKGLPISLQLIAKFGKDNTLLSVAKFVEDAVKFPRINLNTND